MYCTALGTSRLLDPICTALGISYITGIISNPNKRFWEFRTSRLLDPICTALGISYIMGIISNPNKRFWEFRTLFSKRVLAAGGM